MEPWVTPEQIPGGDEFGDLDLLEICAAATEICNLLSGQQFGVGTTAPVRPARISHDCGCLPWWAYGASWYGWSGFTWPDGRWFPGEWGCGCASNKEIILRGRRIRALTVKVDGVVLDPSAYAVLSGRRLVRRDGQAWPCCQRLDLDDSQAGTWSVAYTWGAPPPHIGVLAAKAMSRELGAAFTHPEDCQLPARVTQIVRQGITAAVQDAVTILKEGFTGVAVVDQFIMAVNPGHARKKAAVFTPETLMAYRESH